MSLSEREELKQIHYEYIRSIDDGEPNTLADLFLPDGTFSVGSRTFEGRDEIRGFLEDGLENRPPAYQHLATNPIISIDGDEATARWSYVVLKADDPEGGSGEWGMGTHSVEYRKRDGEWKIVHLAADRTYTGDL